MDIIEINRAAGGKLLLTGYDPPRTVNRAQQNKRLLGEDTVTMSVTSAAALPFAIGDSFTAFGDVYSLNSFPTGIKKGERHFEYELTFEGAQYSLKRIQYRNTDVTGLNTGGTFPLTGDLSMFIGVLMNNISRGLSNWSLGGVIATEEKTLEFKDEDCLAVLQRLCSEFNTEYRIEYNGSARQLFVSKTGVVLPYVFQYGRGFGATTIKRQVSSNTAYFNRLFVEGGTKNIPSSYRGGVGKLLFANEPNNFIENAQGITANGLTEKTISFPDIYPRRTGTVTGLGSTLVTFSDSSMNFDLNAQLLPGSKPKVHFNTGKLAGYEFEVNKYTHSTKTFELYSFQDGGQTYPAAGAFTITTGDTYVLLDILMPQSYVDAAELELKNAAQAYLDSTGKPRNQYSIDLDPLYLQDRVAPGSIYNWFNLGDTVQILDTDLGIEGGSRVIGFSRNVIDEYDYTLDIGDTYDVSIIYRQLNERNQESRILKINDLRDARSAKYSYENQQELLKLVFDPEGNYFTEKIKPLSIETSLIAVGARSQQMVLNITIQPNYGGNPNVVVVSSGTLTHLTIDTQIRTWQVQGGTTTLTDNAARYIYVRASKTNYSQASVVFDTVQRTVDADGGNYYFLIGVLHSVSTDLNIRRISLSYGFTTINGRFITTGVIQSADGKTKFDLDAGTISGRIIFSRSDGTTGTVEEIESDLADFSSVVTGLQTTVGSFQNQIDGKIDSHFSEADPALYFTPGTEITHDGDMWYKPSARELRRYDGNAKLWRLIENQAAVDAYYQASLAKDTADGKRRNFTATPVAPYDAGDTWTQGAGGELMVCIQGRAAGQAYNASDWIKASRYTGDESLVNFVNLTFNPFASGLQAQLDGKIESFFSNQDPNTWPASDRGRHDGDFWFKTDTKKLYRYDGNANAWNVIEDAASLAAFEKASQALAAADGKVTHFTSTPYAPYELGDLWTDGQTLRRCITAKAAGQPFSVLDWASAVSYDSTKTVIDGGLVTSGTIQLAGGDGAIKAGITGVGSGNDAVRIWAGTEFANREFAPFQVRQSGETYVRGRLEILGVVNGNQIGQAGFSGQLSPSDSNVRIWAGTVYAGRDSAPFRVYHDGSMVATAGQIGGLVLASGYLSNTDTQGAYGVLFQSASQGKFVGIGTSTISATVGFDSLGIFQVTTSKPSGGENVGAVFIANGVTEFNSSNQDQGMNMAIYAPEGNSVFAKALINGRRVITAVGTSPSIDTSRFDGLDIDPGASNNNALVTFTSPTLAMLNGKEFVILQSRANGRATITNIIRGQPNYIVEAGHCVTLYYSKGYWYVKSDQQNFY